MEAVAEMRSAEKRLWLTMQTPPRDQGQFDGHRLRRDLPHEGDQDPEADADHEVGRSTASPTPGRP
jgi:hypothetical protein